MADIIARVHDAALINAMADAHDDRRTAARKARPTVRASKRLQAINAERAAFCKAAALVEDAKAAGYSATAAEGLINQGEARAYARHAITNGAIGSAVAPAATIKIKSDNARPSTRMVHASRHAIGREADRPAEMWAEELGEGIQEASKKLDAADTDEWFG